MNYSFIDSNKKEWSISFAYSDDIGYEMLVITSQNTYYQKFLNENWEFFDRWYKTHNMPALANEIKQICNRIISNRSFI